MIYTLFSVVVVVLALIAYRSYIDIMMQKLRKTSRSKIFKATKIFDRHLHFNQSSTQIPCTEKQVKSPKRSTDNTNDLIYCYFKREALI